jgi:hypothetical protein
MSQNLYKYYVELGAVVDSANVRETRIKPSQATGKSISVNHVSEIC